LNWAFSAQNDTTSRRCGSNDPSGEVGEPGVEGVVGVVGFEGRNFVSGGVRASELSRLTGRPAKEPIRVYAGLETADDTDARMR
jgi:uncharacterized membrane protein